jgi:hypothetical protein
LKISIIISLIVLTTSLALAQDEIKTDSLSSRAKDTIGKMDSLKIPRFSVNKPALTISDSLKEKFTGVDSVRQAIGSGTSHLQGIADKPQQEVHQLTVKIDSLRAGLSARIDSLGKMPDPNKVLIKSLDSLRGSLDSLKNSALAKKATDAAADLKAAEEKVSAKVGSVEQKINSKLGLISRKQLNVKTPKIGNAPNPLDKLHANTKLPALQLNNPLKGSKGADLDSKLPNANLGGSRKVGGIFSRPKRKLGSLKQDANLSHITGKMNDIAKTGDKVSGYSKDVQKLASSDFAKTDQLPKDLEQKAMSSDVIKGVQKDLVPANTQMDMVKKWSSDPEYAKELMVNKAKEQVIDHFAGHEKQLTAAMDKFSRMKEKYKDGETVIDLLRKPENPMRAKRLAERLLPALNVQQQFSSHQWFDFNPAIGYRWTGKITSGIGWTERVATNLKQRSFVKHDHAYGPRMYGEFRLKPNFHLRAEAEYLSAFGSPLSRTLTDPSRRQWIPSYFAGIKKSFDFSQSMRGDIQVYYNLYDPHKRSPYISRLNIRAGFELPIKKRQRSTAQ